MLLADDSGSMDLGLVTTEARGELHLPEGSSSTSNAYKYTHPAPGATGDYPAPNRGSFGRDNVVPTQEFLAAEGIAAPQGGVWRAWNHNYNKIYYNPDVEYTPWEGQDVNGAKYTDVNVNNAPYNPYRPSDGGLDLTASISYDTDCKLTDCLNDDDLDGTITVTGFYPARYYTWTDTDADSVVDADDAHTLIEIRSSNFPKNRAGTRTDCGGNGDAASTTSCSYANEIQNFANWFSYFRKRDLTAKSAFSKVIEPTTSARIGFATINNNATNRIKAESMNVSINSGNKLALIDEIFSTIPNGSTPLRQNLRDVGRYFECVTGNIFGLSAESPAEDPEDPSTANNCPIFKAPAGSCQQNYTVLMTDGDWNGSSPSVNNTDGGTSNSDFDGGSFADTSSDTLADVAMHYYERDLHSGTGSLDNNVPTTARDRNLYRGSTDPFESMHQHMATYTIGFGVNGTLTANPTDANTAFSWPDPTDGAAEKIDDLRHAAWNGRGQFLSASDPGTLTSSLEDIFSEITAGTGAASSVAFNTQNLESGALVFRAFFDTNTNTGSLIAQDVSITGQISSSVRWNAAEELDSKTSASSDSREIITYDDLATTPAGIPFQWSDLNATQQGQLNTPVAGSTPPDPLGEERLEYLRGQSEKEAGKKPATNENFRDRPLVGGKLGDIVHSTPVFVGEPPFSNRDQAPFPITTADLYSAFEDSYRNRREMVYIGANDGMLHGFDANDGEEVFAYVPNIGFDQLSKLTDPNYNHRYFVDLSPAVNDVYANLGGGAKWNTVLVGGRGAGGPGFFALDITDPTELDTEAEAADKVLWEFTQADDSNLGTPITEPSIVMTNISSGGQRRWAAIFGNGYNSASTDGNAELFIVFLDGGVDGDWTDTGDYIKISTGNGKAQSADTTTPNSLGGVRSIDTDQDGSVDVVYAGDLQGNVYRFDLSATTTSSWNMQTLFTAKYGSDSGPVQPITNRPIVVKHPTEAGYLVIVGTGSYFTTDDISDTSIQSIYGLWDDFSAASDSISTNKVVSHDRLVEQSFTNQATTISGFTVRTLTNNTISQWGHTGGTVKKEGWVINLDVPPAGGTGVEFPGERAVRNFILRGGLLFVNTVIPKSSSACTVGPGGFELGFNPINGGSGSDIVFDLNNDGNFNESDNVSGADGDANIVTGIRFDESTPTDSSFIGNRKVTQTSDKSIRSVGTNTGNDNAVGRNSWRELDL
ncbi:pilus assembly protein [Sulfuriflexus sp.]|uniref:pilus assembly protein n=1 Tax=Sulfuriflexus sp. TaxID=2015443 RepID=UPI0028D2B917|nr:PilC/PilY family type IV pilus protein [Sulfuriflexus sp.]